LFEIKSNKKKKLNLEI